MAFQKKGSAPTSSFKPMAPGQKDVATQAAKAPDASKDSEGMEMSLPDTMTKIPKLPHIEGSGHDQAHAHNSLMHTKHFGTGTEKEKVKSDVKANYPGAGEDCPMY